MTAGRFDLLRRYDVDLDRDLHCAILPSQLEILRAAQDFVCIIGGWGSSKTTAACLKMLQCAFRNPYDRRIHGGANPFSYVIGPSDSVLRETIWQIYHEILPPEAIRQTWESKPRRMLLDNGHMLVFRSWEGRLEGSSACAVQITEAHLLPSKKDILHYKARARRGNKRLTIVEGLPEDGPLREMFDRAEMPRGQALFKLATKDNPYLPDDYIDSYEAACAFGEELRYLGGDWMVATDAVFHCWDSSSHIIDREGNKDKPVHLSFDLGDRGFALFGQEIPVKVRGFRRNSKNKREEYHYYDKGLLLIDEIPCDGLGTEEMCEAAKLRGWIVHPDHSKIFVDPTTRKDEQRAVERAFGDVDWIRHRKGDEEFERRYGYRCVNRALRDMHGNRRLFVSKSLAAARKTEAYENPARGVVAIFQQSRKNPRTGRPKRENRLEHGRDCVRYMVQDVLPIDMPEKHEVTPYGVH